MKRLVEYPPSAEVNTIHGDLGSVHLERVVPVSEKAIAVAIMDKNLVEIAVDWIHAAVA